MTKMDIAVVFTLAIMMAGMLIFRVSSLFSATAVLHQHLVPHCNCLCGQIKLNQDVYLGQLVCAASSVAPDLHCVKSLVAAETLQQLKPCMVMQRD